MSFGNIMQGKRMSQYALLFICFLILAFPVDAKAEAESVSVTLVVEQVFTKNSSAANISDIFSYELISLEAGNPMPSGTVGGIYSFTITNTAIKQIHSLTFHHAGVYLYEISMKMPTPLSGYHYDAQVYHILFFVKQTDDTFSVEIVVEKSDGNKADSIKFEHAYTPLPSNADLMETLSVRKTVAGEIPYSDNDFTFTLTARDIANPMPAGSSNGVKEIIITGSGQNVFEAWSYTKEGTYYYDIAETIRRNTSYTYDESVYTVIDVVKDVDGQLVVTRTVTNEANKPVSACLFVNEYKRKRRSGGGSNIKKAVSVAETDVDIEIGKDNEITENTEPDIGNQDNNDLDIGIPKVGDESRFELYAALVLFSIIILIGCILYLLLVSNRRTQKATKKVSFLLSAVICLILFSGYQLWQNLRSYQEANQSYEHLKQQVWYQVNDSFNGLNNSTKRSPNINFEVLKKVNEDAVAWLYSPDTVIDYPVMRANDYNWYLHYLPDGTYNANGSLFLDYNGEDNFEGRLNIIYGHHMKSGQMFGSLKGYQKQEYFERHPYLYLYTKEEDYRIDLKYGCVISAGIWREQAFMYELNLDSLLRYAAARTTFESAVEYTNDDKFVVLATCSYEFEDARYIVIGVLRPDDRE